jgi:drug/metabolite transporter (DMT)-like permease
LWNEAITLIGTQTALIYYLIPVFSGVLPTFFLNQAIVLTQISMVIITGLLLTNKKHDFRFIKKYLFW